MRQSSRITFRSTFRIKISDRERDTLIGYAGDVSECGMKLLSDALVEPGSMLKLRVRMRDREGNLRQVDVDMVCQWSQENTNRNEPVATGTVMNLDSNSNSNRQRVCLRN